MRTLWASGGGTSAAGPKPTTMSISMDQRRQRQEHGAPARPAVERQPPALLDELASRRRLDDEPRRLDERRDEVVLGVVVEAQIGAHLGKRHGLDGGTGDE